MDKVVTVQARVNDLYGLYMDLRKSRFRVKNVGASQKDTIVHLDPAEDKDPAPIVQSWVGKVPLEPSLSETKKRIQEMEKILEVEKKEEEARKIELLQDVEEKKENQNPPVDLKDEEGNDLGELMGEPAKSSESFVKKIWKKLF
jgi:hypothetical protein